MLDYYKNLIAATRTVTPSTPLAGDYGTMVVGHSLRQIRTAYAGNVALIRRDSDDATLAVNGDEVTDGTLASFLSGANGYVARIYNQGTEANADLYQNTASLQPKIHDSTTGFILKNGVIDITFTTNQYLTSDWNSYPTDKFTTFQVFTYTTDLMRVNFGYDYSPKRGLVVSLRSLGLYWDGRPSGGNLGRIVDSSINSGQVLFFGAYDRVNMKAAGNDTAVASTALSTGTILYQTTNYEIGRYNVGSGNVSCPMNWQEGIIYSTDESVTNRVAIRDEINTYYGIY